MNEEYNTYKKLKQRFSVKYRGINIAQVLALDLWQWTLRENIMNIPVIAMNLSVDFSFLKKVSKEKIIYYDMGRSDHEATFHLICDKLPTDYEIINLSNIVPHIECKSKKNKFLSKLLVNWITRGLKYTKEERLHMSFRVCLILNSIDNLYQNCSDLKNIKHFVAYSAIHTWGNLMGQFFRKRKAKFWGLSHASHYLYSTNIPIDCLNYDNLDVDYSVTWGQYTKEEYTKYGVKADEIFIAGYPKKITVHKVKTDNKFKKCLILLARSSFDHANMQLMDIICKMTSEYDFYIKLHPSCDFISYKSYSEKNHLNLIGKDVLLTECFDNTNYDFAIAVNTTAYYEIITAGIPCLRYKDDDAYDLTYGFENDAFTNTESFQESMTWLKESITSGNYNKKAYNILQYVLGIGQDNYRAILP